MRITGLRATPVAVPFREDELWAFGGRRGMVGVVLEVDTDDVPAVVEAVSRGSIQLVRVPGSSAPGAS